MASAAPPSVASTKETTNYARLCRLLVDVGSQALRDTFDCIHPPPGLYLVLARHPEHATLQTLRTRRILNPTQWGKLYPTIPSTVSSASFDITLLMLLLRNICGLRTPATGWGSLPSPTDTSKEANIARVKYYHNTVYGDASQASVDDATFNTYWQDISNALVALGGASYGAAISKLRNECMDPDTEDHYRELLKQWKKDLDSIKDKVDEIEEKFRDEQMKDEIKDIKERLDVLTKPPLVETKPRMEGLFAHHSMASAAPPPVASTKETTNYARLCRLLVDVGSQALRVTFDVIHPPAGLHHVLARHPAHATLQTLRKKRILNDTQWGLLYPTIPPTASSASFDITLLMVLLRNICGLHAPTTGWDSLPSPADASKEANIARVKYYRNTVYRHANQASVDDATFNAYWQDISNALVALGGASYGAAINKLKTECMDSDTEKHYRGLLKQWKKDLDSIKDKLDEIEERARDEQMKVETKDIKDRLDVLTNALLVEGLAMQLEQCQDLLGKMKEAKLKMSLEIEKHAMENEQLKKCIEFQEAPSPAYKLKLREVARELEWSKKPNRKIKEQLDQLKKKKPGIEDKSGNPSDDELERLSLKVGEHWIKLGRHLKVEGEKLTAFDKENQDLTGKACKMLLYWKQRDGSAATYQVLHDACELVGRKDLAMVLQTPLRAAYAEHARTLEQSQELLRKKREDELKMNLEIEKFDMKLEQFKERIRELQEVPLKDKLQLEELAMELEKTKDKLNKSEINLRLFQQSWMEDETRDVSKQIRSEIRDMTPREGTMEEEHPMELEQMADEIRNIKEDLDQQRMEVDETSIVRATMAFQAEHEECLRVCPYYKNGEVVVHFYVYSRTLRIPKALITAAQEFFGEMRVKLEWSDLYNNADDVLNVGPIEYPSGKPKSLEASQVDKIDKIINENLHVFSKHRNITALQPSLKVTKSVQTKEACIAVYVLGKGNIPIGESAIPSCIESAIPSCKETYPVDIVNGFCVRTNSPKMPLEAHKQSDVLRLGASIGGNGKEFSATLGAVVEDETSGTLYALSNDHAMKHQDTTEIIHPGMDAYHNYLLYYLNEYKTYITQNHFPKGCKWPQISINVPQNREELLVKFNKMKTTKEEYIDYIRFRKEIIKETEKKLEEGFSKQPRIVANYSAGLRCNVVSSNGKKHFIDVAVSELMSVEIKKLQGNEMIEIIDTAYVPSGECIPATTKAILEAEEMNLFKSGSGTGFTQFGLLVGGAHIPVTIAGFQQQGNSPWIDVECLICREKPKTKEASSQVQTSGQKKPKEASSQVQESSCCEMCKPDAWLKSCLCFRQQGDGLFSGDGDSGAVIFAAKQKEKKEEEENEKEGEDYDPFCPALGIIFGKFKHQYSLYTLASPLEIALEELSKKVSQSESKPFKLRLASSFIQVKD